MNGRTRLITPGAPLRALGILPLLLLSATGAHGALQDIDMTCLPAPGIHTIEAVVGTPLAGQNIGVLNAAANVFWDFLAAPPGCGAGPTSYTCSGVTITLPPGSPDNPVSNAQTVTVSGNPTAPGSFSFTLQVANDGAPGSCSREYHLVITTPFDLVMVLDRSGSMNSATHVLPPATNRWDALKRAVNHFTPIVEASECASVSQFGLTLFSTAVIANNSFPAGLTAIDGDLDTDVAAELTSQSPGGLTALGAGLQNGIGKFTDPARKRVVMVFTDGEQNQSPLVDHLTGASYVPGGPIAPGGAGAFRIVTVGIGNPMGDYQLALQNLAAAHDGTYHVTATGEDIAAALDTATQSLLDGCSAQMVTSASGTLSGPTTLAAFDLNRLVGRLIVKISWSRDFEVPDLARLLAGLRILKDGEDVTGFFEPVIVGNFTNTVILRADLPFVPESDPPIPAEGGYTVTMQPPAGLALGYRAVVFADDRRLGMAWRIDPAAPRVEQPFRPTMRLSWLGRPVTDADVEALILKPGDDLGDLLARDPSKVDPSTAPDAGSPGYQKFLERLEDPEFLGKLLPDEQRLTLSHRGDGVYSAAFDPGDVSGVYQVIYRVSADDPAIGKVERLAFQSAYVRFGAIDLAASGVTTTVTADGTVLLDFRPITVHRRFIGPAQASGIAVTGPGVVVRGITDHQDGRYTIALAADPGAEISVSVLGDEIYQGPASGFGVKKCAKWPRCLRWLCRLFHKGV